MTKVFPVTNKFRRLLLHRLAQRFRLARTGEDSHILLTKTSDLVMPRMLLVDIPSEGGSDFESNLPREPSSDSIQGVASNDRRQNESSVLSDNLNSKEKSSGTSQRKVVMMKRDTSNESRSGKKEQQQRQQSSGATDKAKQYAEAKARIFGLDASESEANTDPIPTYDVVSSQSVANFPSYNPQQLYPSNTLSSSSTKASRISPSPIGNNASSSSARASSSASGSNGTNVSNKTSKNKKALERDRGADEKDPDFMRNNTRKNVSTPPQLLVPPQAPSSAAGNPSYPPNVPFNGMMNAFVGDQMSTSSLPLYGSSTVISPSPSYFYTDYSQQQYVQGQGSYPHDYVSQHQMISPPMSNAQQLQGYFGNTATSTSSVLMSLPMQNPLQHPSHHEYNPYYTQTSSMYTAPNPSIGTYAPIPHQMYGQSFDSSQGLGNSGRGNDAYLDPSEFPPLR